MTKAQALTFFGTLGVCAAVSVAIFLNRKPESVVAPPDPPRDTLVQEEMPKTGDGKAAMPDQKQPGPDQPSQKPSPEPGVTPSPEPAPKPAAMPDGFRTPEALARELFAKVKAHDLEGFVRLAGEEALAADNAERIRGVVASQAYAPSASPPLSEIGRSVTMSRWSIPLSSDSPPEGLPSSPELLASLRKGEDGNAWHVAEIRMSVDSDQPMDPAAPGTDALTVAKAFVDAVLSRDFNAARTLADPYAVTDERLAALLIALEEGSFNLRSDKPLVITLERDDLTWVIASLGSDSEDSEFGLNLTRKGDRWVVSELTFSRLLTAMAEEAGAGGVAYSPIIENPKGGEVLVLYFEFDEDRLTGRAIKQLSVVADILKKDPGRKLNIGGHADAKGTDPYNLSLSKGRAAAVKQELLNMGVGADQVLTEAYGEAKPLRPNTLPSGEDDPVGRSQNRRAEVFLSF